MTFCPVAEQSQNPKLWTEFWRVFWKFSAKQKKSLVPEFYGEHFLLIHATHKNAFFPFKFATIFLLHFFLSGRVNSIQLQPDMSRRSRDMLEGYSIYSVISIGDFCDRLGDCLFGRFFWRGPLPPITTWTPDFERSRCSPFFSFSLAISRQSRHRRKLSPRHA